MLIRLRQSEVGATDLTVSLPRNGGTTFSEKSHMAVAPYRLSFTTGGLLRSEAVAVSALLVSGLDAGAVRERAIADNVVQQRTSASRTRVTREVAQRLEALPQRGIDLLANGSVDETRQLMWLAACHRYQLLRDFGREVVRERHLSGINEVTYQDFDAFWNVQSSWIDALRDAADSTRAKLRQNAFRMLAEAGLMDKDSRVQPVLISHGVAATASAMSPELLLSFPIDDGQAATLMAAGNGAR